jgi:hypothetical protein
MNKNSNHKAAKKCANFLRCKGAGHTEPGKSKHLLTKYCPYEIRGTELTANNNQGNFQFYYKNI